MEKNLHLKLNRYEQGIMINALNDKRSELIENSIPTDAVDELILKTIDAPTKKSRGMCK